MGCLFVLFIVSFAVQKLLNLIRFHLFLFCISITLGGGTKILLCVLCSYKSFIVSGLTFKSLIYFEFIFVYGVRKRSVLSMVLQSFILRAVKFSHHRLLKMLSFLYCIFLPYLLKIRCP